MMVKPAVTEMWEAAAARLRDAGIESPALEAQLLVGIALGLSRTQVLLGTEVSPSSNQVCELERLVEARENRVPLAYLRGTQEFYGLTFEVTPAVLIPRPETELLVDIAVERLAGIEGGTLLDVGTGSGCIAITVARSLPRVRCVGVDVSDAALEVARANAERLGVGGRAAFLRGDMLDSVGSRSAEGIVSNPPYIRSEEIPALQAEVRDHEPDVALDGGADGLRFHRRLAAGATRVLKRGGFLAVEVAMGQAAEVAELMGAAGFVRVQSHRDLASIERVVSGRLPEG
jgi:release factor glutamine methyltransferase